MAHGTRRASAPVRRVLSHIHTLLGITMANYNCATEPRRRFNLRRMRYGHSPLADAILTHSKKGFHIYQTFHDRIFPINFHILIPYYE